MAYEAPALGTAGQVYTAAAHNIIVNDVLDHEARLLKSGLVLTGTLTISAATSGTLNNCFSSLYDNYKLVIAVSAATASDMTMQLTAGGIAATTGYLSQRIYNSSASALATDQNVLGTDEWIYATGGSSSTGLGSAEATIYGPAIAAATAYTAHSFGNSIIYLSGGNHSTATAYDGIKLLHSGSASLKLKVYGYLNS